MAAKIYRINYKSDFILTLTSDAGWTTPFCIKFWTGAPAMAYYAGWDGTTYTHCAYDPAEPTKLQVQFDDHHLPVGDLKFQIGYHFTVADFPNDTEDEVINPASIVTEIDGEEHQVMLDFTGETAPEIEFALPAYANEQQRIENEQQRIANEQQRIAAEEQRVTDFGVIEEQAQQAIGEAGSAAQAAYEAAGEAANVNAELDGTILTVTNRQGTSTSVNTKGEQGEQGNPGQSATISVGTTTTGAPGTNAQVTNSGTSSAAVLNFTIPKGDKGEQGEPGEVTEAELYDKTIIEDLAVLTPYETLLGKYLKSNGDIGDSGAYNIVSYAVTPGDIILVHNLNHAGTATAWATYTNNQYGISTKVDVGVSVGNIPDDYRITIGAGATYLCITTRPADAFSVSKVNAETVKSRLLSLEDEVLSLENEVDAQDRRIEDAEDDMDDIQAELFEDRISELPVSRMGVGEYLNSLGNLSSGGAFNILVFNVNEGDHLQLVVTGAAGSVASYAFYNVESPLDTDIVSSNVVGSVGPATPTGDFSYDLTVPVGAKSIVVSKYTNATVVLKKIVTVSLGDKVDELGELIGQMSRMAVSFDGTNLLIATLVDGKEYTYWFKKCLANELFTFYVVGFRTVTRKYPSTKNIMTDAQITVINAAGSDNIGPFNINPGGWIGGNHTLDGAKTAKTESFAIYVDGKTIQDDGSTIYGDSVQVFVNNTLYNPNIAEGGVLSTPIASVNEVYSVKGNSINVSVRTQFVSGATPTMDTYYGMQSMFVNEDYFLTPNGQFATSWATDATASFAKQDYPNFNTFIEKKSGSYYQSSFLRPFKAGGHGMVANDQNIFVRSGGKIYHRMISPGVSLDGLVVNWSGVYTFFASAVEDDSNLLAYVGVIDGKDAVFIHTKQSFSGDVLLPSRLLLRKMDIVQQDTAITTPNTCTDAGGVMVEATGAGTIVFTLNP